MGSFSGRRRNQQAEPTASAAAIFNSSYSSATPMDTDSRPPSYGGALTR